MASRRCSLRAKVCCGCIQEDFSWFDVPLSVSEDFAAALQEAGYDAEVVVEGGEHIEIWEDTPPQQAVVAQVGELLADL